MRDPDRSDLPDPKKWGEEDDDGGPDPMDLSEGRKASTSREPTPEHRSPDVTLKSPPDERENASQGRSAFDEARSWFGVARLRARNALSRIVQLSGWYLIVLSLATVFDPILRQYGVGVGGLPDLVLAPLQQLGVSPLISLVVGFVVVWFSTSVWFLGTGTPIN